MVPSTYIIGQDSVRERHYVIRTVSPRFIAELVEPDEADDGLILEDGEGLRVSQWIDTPQPSANIKPYLAEISVEVKHHAGTKSMTWNDTPAEEPALPPLDAL